MLKKIHIMKLYNFIIVKAKFTTPANFTSVDIVQLENILNILKIKNELKIKNKIGCYLFLFYVPCRLSLILKHFNHIH